MGYENRMYWEGGNGFPDNLVHEQALMTLEILKYVDDLLRKHWLGVVEGWARGNMPNWCTLLWMGQSYNKVVCKVILLWAVVWLWSAWFIPN